MDTFRQIKEGEKTEIKIKGSRFLGEAVPVKDEEEGLAALEVIRKREYNATHNCWAYRVGHEGTRFRYSDDGEPNGTAGLPIFRQIEGRDITNTLVVVTRYYGGTKLGTGGLIRAYGEAASDVLDLCAIEKVILRTRVKIRFAYPDTSPAMHTIDSFDVKVEASNYGDDTELVLAIRRSEVEAFAAQFVEKLAGRGDIQLIE